MFPIEIQKVKADVVVVGGGGAACRAALSARQAGASVRLVTKAPLRAGGSTVHGASEIMSMGAAGFGDSADSPDVHFEDTMRAGRGFIDPVLVRALTEDAPQRIRDLVALGVPFDHVDHEHYKLIRSDFGSYARTLGVAGKTGKAFVAALADELMRLGVAVDERTALVDLIRDREGAISGVLAYDAEQESLIQYEAPCVILGTGGMHGAFEQQVSTAEMTGDGQAICFRHGAEMVNLEFHQFGPALIHPYVQLFSGSCFRLHPQLINAEGNEFLTQYVPRDVPLAEVYDRKVFPFTTTNVSRYIEIAMAREIAAGRGTPRGAVYLSFAHVAPERIEAVMPNTARWMHEHGLDARHDRLEAGIAFQCMNGGVRMIDATAQSTIPGLYVIGELAGGVRGPDRPGGNSLAEGQVFGHRSGLAAAQRARQERAGQAHTLDETMDFLATVLQREGEALNMSALARDVRRAMQRHCLVEKSAAGLNEALSLVRSVKGELERKLALKTQRLLEGLNLRNLVQAAELVLLACLNREETRSSHYRLDFPEKDDRYAVSFVMRGDGDAVATSTHRY